MSVKCDYSVIGKNDQNKPYLLSQGMISALGSPVITIRSLCKTLQDSCAGFTHTKSFYNVLAFLHLYQLFFFIPFQLVFFSHPFSDTVWWRVWRFALSGCIHAKLMK